MSAGCTAVADTQPAAPGTCAKTPTPMPTSLHSKLEQPFPLRLVFPIPAGRQLYGAVSSDLASVDFDLAVAFPAATLHLLGRPQSRDRHDRKPVRLEGSQPRRLHPERPPTATHIPISARVRCAGPKLSDT